MSTPTAAQHTQSQQHNEEEHTHTFSYTNPHTPSRCIVDCMMLDVIPPSSPSTLSALTSPAVSPRPSQRELRKNKSKRRASTRSDAGDDHKGSQTGRLSSSSLALPLSRPATSHSFHSCSSVSSSIVSSATSSACSSFRSSASSITSVSGRSTPSLPSLTGTLNTVKSAVQRSVAIKQANQNEESFNAKSVTKSNQTRTTISAAAPQQLQLRATTSTTTAQQLPPPPNQPQQQQLPQLHTRSPNTIQTHINMGTSPSKGRHLYTPSPPSTVTPVHSIDPIYSLSASGQNAGQHSAGNMPQNHRVPAQPYSTSSHHIQQNHHTRSQSHTTFHRSALVSAPSVGSHHRGQVSVDFSHLVGDEGEHAPLRLPGACIADSPQTKSKQMAAGQHVPTQPRPISTRSSMLPMNMLPRVELPLTHSRSDSNSAIPGLVDYDNTNGIDGNTTNAIGGHGSSTMKVIPASLAASLSSKSNRQSLVVKVPFELRSMSVPPADHSPHSRGLNSGNSTPVKKAKFNNCTQCDSPGRAPHGPYASPGSVRLLDIPDSPTSSLGLPYNSFLYQDIPPSHPALAPFGRQQKFARQVEEWMEYVMDNPIPKVTLEAKLNTTKKLDEPTLALSEVQKSLLRELSASSSLDVPIKHSFSPESSVSTNVLSSSEIPKRPPMRRSLSLDGLGSLPVDEALPLVQATVYDDSVDEYREYMARWTAEKEAEARDILRTNNLIRAVRQGLIPRQTLRANTTSRSLFYNSHMLQRLGAASPVHAAKVLEYQAKQQQRAGTAPSTPCAHHAAMNARGGSSFNFLSPSPSPPLPPQSPKSGSLVRQSSAGSSPQQHPSSPPCTIFLSMVESNSRNITPAGSPTVIARRPPSTSMLSSSVSSRSSQLKFGSNSEIVAQLSTLSMDRTSFSISVNNASVVGSVSSNSINHPSSTIMSSSSSSSSIMAFSPSSQSREESISPSTSIASLAAATAPQRKSQRVPYQASVPVTVNTNHPC